MKSKRLKKYLLIKDKDGIYNKVIKAPLFKYNYRKYIILHEVYASSKRYAECHFGFFGWAIIGDWPFLELSSKERMKIMNARDLFNY